MEKYEKLPLPAQEIVDKLELEKSEEGVYVKSVYKSPNCYAQDKERFAATTAYVLTAFAAPSRWHRLDCDEIWHFYNGKPIDVFLFFADRLEKITFGPNFLDGEQPKIVIPKGTVFGALVKDKEDWCLFGCTCVPGFTKKSCELIEKDNPFFDNFTEHQELIEKLTK